MADGKTYGSENRRKLYENLTRDGFDLGTIEDFNRNMDNQNTRRAIYDAAKGAGWELPEYGQYDRDMSVRRLKIGGKVQEVSHDTYDSFIKRHPSGTTKKPAQPVQPVSQPREKLPAPLVARKDNTPSGISGGAPFRNDLTAAERAEIERNNNYAAKQVDKLREGRKREEARRNAPIATTGNEAADRYIVKTQGQLEDEVMNGVSELGSKYVSPMVDNALKKAEDDWYASMAESSSVPMGEGGELFALRRANEKVDPDKILKSLQQSLENAYSNPEMIRDIENRAKSAGISKDDYLKNFVIPSLKDQLAGEFNESMIARSMPKNSVEYILQGMSDSIAGMLLGAATETKSQRYYKNQADALTEQGENPYYNPGTGAKLTKMGISFAADAPFFGVYGRVSGQVVKNIAQRQISKMMAKGLSETAARSIVGTALENSVGARMKNYLMQHVVSSSLTLGGYNATSETARQLRDKEGIDLGEIAGSTAEGLATGAAFGFTGGFTQALSQPLSGISKIGAKVAGFGAEAETMYATEELAKLAHGEEAFTNPFEGSAEAVMKLGVMKLSGGHLLESGANKLMRAKEVGTKQAAAEAIGGLLGPNKTGAKFTPEEQAYIRNSAEGRNLVEALSRMHPEIAVSEVNGKKKFTKEGETLRQQLADNYNAFMSNTEIPADTKLKVAQILGGLYRPGLETGADIIHNIDGSVILKTRDKDGNCIQDLKFDSFSEAEEWREAHTVEFRLNDAVNGWNGTTQENRLAAVTEISENLGVSWQDAKDMVYKVLDAKDTSLNNEQYNIIFDAINRNAYPEDEYNPKRRYQEGRQISPEERHFAQVEAQLAEEALRIHGDEFADEVIAAIEYPDEKIAELASTDGIAKEQIEAAMDYYNATSKVNGMIDEAIKSVDEQVEAENSRIRKNIHTDSGSLIEASYKGGQYYITAGHFQLSPEGRLVPTDNSGLVILRDKNTGEIVTASPSDVMASAVYDPNRIMAENDSMEGLRGRLMKEADDSIELHPDTPEEAANGDIYTGADGNQYMAMMTQDEAGNPVWAKVVIGEDGNPVGAPMVFDMDEYRKAKSDEIDAANRPQEELPMTVVDNTEPAEIYAQNAPEIIPDEVKSEPINEREDSGILDNAGGEASRDQAGANEPPATATSRIPVDDKGKKIYEQAKPEDTIAELTEKYGNEGAQQFVIKMAENTTMALDDLLKKDTSKITDANDLEAYNDEVAALQQKSDYWKGLVPKETERENIKSTEPEPQKEALDTAEKKPTEAQKKEEEEKPDNKTAGVNTQQQQSDAQRKVYEGSVKNNVGRTFEFTDKSGKRTEITITGMTEDGQAEVRRRDFDAQGNQIGEERLQQFPALRIGEGIVGGTWKRSMTDGERLREAYRRKMGMEYLIDTLSEEEASAMWAAHERVRIENSDAAKADLRELIDELRNKHVEDIVDNMRARRVAEAEKALSGGSFDEKLRKLKRAYQGIDGIDDFFSGNAVEPVTIEEYAAAHLGDVPKAGAGFIDHESLAAETGHGLRRIGGDSRAYSSYLAPKGKGKSIKQVAHEMWQDLPERLHNEWSDQDCLNALIEVLTSGERPSDIAGYILKNRQQQAEELARKQEENDLAAFHNGEIKFQKVVRERFRDRLDSAIADTDTEPTEAQKKEGNYKKGHISFGGYDFTIENPTGSMRSGTDSDGRKWEQKMNNTYGYILGKYGKDGDHLDMFINDDADLDRWNGNVYVIDQVDPKTGKFDEHKIVFGYDSEAEAREAYLSNYEEGWQGLGKITGVSKETFDKWLDSSERKMKPFADHSLSKEAAHKVEKEPVSPASDQEKVLRDAVVEHLRSKGIEVSDHWKEGQRILDEYNGKDQIRQQKTETPIFVSNALKVVEGIKQEKATPEQWLAMIQKNGGLKAGEDKWIGLSDWLKQQKRSITKQEVLDFIRDNQIQIEEVNYKEFFDVDDNPQMQKFRSEFDGLVEKYESEKNAVEQEANTFNDEMYQKYGGGWANDPERLSEEDRKRNDDMVERWNSMNDSDPHDLAFREMVDNYGDDFEMAFEVNSGNGKLEPQTDMYDEQISDAAKHFLQFEDEPIDSTRLGYTTDGLENKKEIALTVPTIDPYNESDNIHFGDAGGGRAVAWIRFGETTIDVPATNLDKSLYTAKRSKNGGFDVFRPNGSEWGRIGVESEDQAIEEAYNDDMLRNTTTQRVLVIDEIQSKRHQDGREKGYRTDDAVAEEEKLGDAVNEAQDAYDAYTRKMGDKYNGAYEDIYSEMTEAEQAEADRLENEVYAASERLQNHDISGVPDAPFEKNWHELALKRMLRYAAENGYDKVAWTKGDQQAERYNIGNVVDKIISYDYPEVDDPDGRKTKKIEVRLKDGETMTMRVGQNGKVIEGRSDTEGKDLTDVVGKELAKRIMDGEGKDGTIFDANKDLPAKVIEGEGLRIGGDGMKGFYDQILPRFMDKYGKKWGVKTGEVELPGLDPAGTYSSKTAKMWAVDVTPEMKESVMQGQPMFFKTPDGQAYGYTYNGKIYIDPRIATSETPIHEYSHLWAEMKRQTAPDEWNDIKQVMLTDKLVQPIIDRVKRDYPELTKEGREDDFIEEIITQFSGKRGAERLREIANEVAQENGGIFGKAEAVTAMQRMKNILNRFWEGVAKMMGWKYRNANQIADRIMADMLNGVDPTKKAKDSNRLRKQAEMLKQTQLDIILKNNPADDENMPGHTWIRSLEDIKTFKEALEYDGLSVDENVTPDFTADMVRDALKTGEVTVYSSKPIKDGIFVTPSKMEAQNYAGDGKVYSKKVPLSDVAWIDAVQGQYAETSKDPKLQMVGRTGAAEADRTEGNDERTRNLRLAEEAEKAGEDAHAIKFATGWERGADGQWRYEIPDADVDILSKYKAKVDEMKKDGVGNPQPIIKLGNLLGEDNELFKYYPKLKKTDVLFSDMLPQNVAGRFDGANIELNSKGTSLFDTDDLNNENVYGTLLHEVQHVIQEIEGFAQGGSLQTSTTEDGINAIISKKKQQQSRIKQQIDSNESYLKTDKELELAAMLDGRTIEEERKHLQDENKRLANEYDNIGMTIDRIQHTKAPSMSDARDLYHRLAGEVEARNVTSRMNMTDEARMTFTAEETEDVPRKDQVIIMGDGTSMNINDIKPVGKGDFGDIYDQFKGKPKEAVDFLIKKKGGDLLGVFHRDEVGDIDLVWGESHNPYKGKGLSHIIKKHIDTLHDFKDIDDLSDKLDDVVNNGNVGYNGNNIEITKDGYRVVLAQENDGKKWILTAFDNSKTKKEKLSSVNTPGTPIDNSGSRAVAADDASLSEGKDTKNTDTIQENEQKSSAEAPKFQRAVSPEPEMTPEERQYWKKWDAAMAKWKERNAIPKEMTQAPEKPRYQQGEAAMDYAKKLMEWNRQKSLWQTAPKLEDYRKVRDDKDILEAARENERRYPDSVSAKMRRAAAEFRQIRSAMSRQKAYDKATVKAVTDFTQEYMKLGFGDNLGRGEIERLLSSVKNATGSKDIRKSVDNIMNILADNQLRNFENTVVKLSSVKELRQTAQGVEKQGKLELKGQRMIQEFRKAREGRLTAEQIRERMSDVLEKMSANDGEAPMREQEYEGLSIALQYVEDIEGSQQEWADLDTLYKNAVKDYKTSGRSYRAQQEYLESLEQAMQENKIDRIGLYGGIIGRLGGNIEESIQGAKEFVERDKERVKKIQQMANFDLAGKDMGAMRESTKGKPANFFLQPLGTFEQMLKQFGSRNANGEGYLYDYFMRNWMDATDKAFTNEQKAKEDLDAKAREVFGGKVKRWSDLYDISRSLPTMDVEVLDGEEPKTFKLTQGNLLYIYMADKMVDGRMKLRKMGIDEDAVEKIKDFMDPRLVQLGDWLQGEYLPQKRTEYNKVHERMFGAPMAAIDNYFPLKVLGDARYQEQDVNVPDSETLPSTITGNIIKRRKNALPLDILHTDALSLAIEHVEDMERWAAQAEWNRDVNTLLSYTTFRNKVKNMKTIYGSGDALWNAFKDAAKMAAGTYNPSAKSGHVDAAISNIAKGVTAAKINFRVYTAFKQILSAPAFLHDVNLADFVHDSANPYGSWKWAMENMPVFQKRWKSRQVGDTRLMDDPTDWKMWKSNVVQMATRMGMSPNALVDGITCAVGARSIYETRYKKYKNIGASDEVARKRALQDAEIGYNLTQQSSEGAFVSSIQKDRTVAANMLSVFRNSSMAYTRQWVDAARNLNKRLQKGYKEDSIKFMARQMQDQFNLDETDAKKAAEQEYAREGRRDVARMLNMMFGVTVAWNLGASLPYLLIGDDDNTKKEMLTDALLKGLLAGPVEGLAAGNLISDFVGRTIASEETRKTVRNEGWGAGVDAALKQGGDYEVNPLPLMADIQGMIKKLGYDKFAAAQDVFNICMQSAVGVNPQTFTDMWNACMDYGAPAWDGTKITDDQKDFARPKEIALFIMRVMNAPTNSWRNKYIDELGMNAEDAQKLPYEEMAKRYANYKHWKDAPIMGWLRGEEGREAKMEKIMKQFDKAVDERIARLTDDELKDNLFRSKSIEEKRRYAKLIHKRLGGNGKDSENAKEDWQREYQTLMQFDDIREDEELSAKKKAARDRGDSKTVKSIEKLEDRIRDDGKKKLGKGEDDSVVMNNIRKWRAEALETAMKAEPQQGDKGHYDDRGVWVYDSWEDAPQDGAEGQKDRTRNHTGRIR